jgi:uncharacterized membrane protein
MKNNVKQLVVMSLLVSLLLIFAFTPIGYLKIGLAEITFMCLPVIIGTITLGLVPGLILSIIFAFTSLYQLLAAPFGLFGIIFSQFGLWPLILVIFLPRMLIAVFTHLVNRAARKAKPSVRYAAASVAGSLTNTVFVLGGTYLLYSSTLSSFFAENMGVSALAGLGFIVLTNGLAEAASALLVCTAVLLALRKAMPSMFAGDNA